MKINFQVWGGITGLILGGYMIFINQDNWGFLPSMAGALLLLRRK